MNAETFEEKFSFLLSLKNVVVAVGILSIFLIFLTTYIIAFTPLREFIPGYSDAKTRQKLITLALKTDSLEQALINNDKYLANIRNILEGKTSTEISEPKKKEGLDYTKIDISKTEQEKKFIQANQQLISKQKSPQLFIKPIEGDVIEPFDWKKKNFGVVFQTANQEPVKAAMEGEIQSVRRLKNNLFEITIQHTNNLKTVYQHLYMPSKQQGDKVNMGDVIGICSSLQADNFKPLYFQIWYKNTPIDPQKYILNERKIFY